ncbi:radical SAM protein [Anaerobranca gottschalkii]|uniref:Elp3/MiaA/NifB-like radical SAM core domain-containing protein n=1 Tax=Anaerobranca gottschalkii DSM 13577 TaxID=1120990 RepID=A0A1H9Y315_9FIRM|nr:radical SAM protein [Anaerobranca gottschalkii]SES63096.1 hypothetical protein SAMN03080614_1001114 [Anaerobranca gottschalkii DSM 13577]
MKLEQLETLLSAVPSISVDHNLIGKLREGWEVRLENFPKEIQFDYPNRTLPVTLTGSDCSLNCAHCGGHYLKGMKPLTELKNLEDYSSCLISGGCSRDGKVPILGFAQEIGNLKGGKAINLHSGLVDEEGAKKIASVADVVSFDFIYNDDVIKKVYKLNKGKEDYVDSYLSLRKHLKVVPHICIGLYKGEIFWEYQALEKLKELGVDALSFIVFVPTKGTEFAEEKPPSPLEVIDVIVRARILFPKTPIYLGCMRPKGSYRNILDPLAVLAGVNKLVIPAPKGREMAEKLGLSIKRGSECCGLD